jgi:hypothetical protein
MDGVDDLSLDEQLEAGRRQWTVAWRRFARQWTQPQLLKLADAVMGGRYLHSSQISGFATGKLREPAPKVFVVIGRLNQCIATGQLPSDLQALWVNKKVLTDKDGTTLDAVGCFRAFTGELDLGLGSIRYIPEDQVDEAVKHLGRYVRGQLSKAGVDFIEALPDLVAECGASAQAVLLGKSMSSDELTESLQAIEAMLRLKGLDINEDRLWAIIHDFR